jgi:small subunit ribosomal protein S27e
VTGKFVKIKCADCSNEQIAFARPSTVVTCHACGSTLIVPKGGKGQVKGEIVEVIG